jgi:general secretion pathway protein D
MTILGKRPFLVAASLFLFCNSAPSAEGPSAGALFKQGAAAEVREDIDSAYELFHKAFQLNPSDLRYRTAYERTRVTAAAFHATRGEELQAAGEQKAAMVEYLRAQAIDPSNERVLQDLRATKEKMDSSVSEHPETSLLASSAQRIKKLRSSVELRPLGNEPLTLHMVEDSKSIYQTIGKLAGINVIFDPDYSGKRIQVDLSQVSIFDALEIVATLSGTFWRPVTANTIFVAQGTRAKRTELEQTGVQTFYISNAAQQNDLNDIQTALRNVLPNAKLYGVPSQNAIVMRATPDELLLAQKLIDDLDKAKPEVVVDVSVLEVSRDKLRNLGIQWPQNFSLTLQASTASSTSNSTSTSSTSTTSATLNELAHLNASDFAITLGEAQAEMLLTDSDTRVLQNPRVRATDGQEAVLKIGSRIPIATGTYTASTSSSSSGTQTQFQYIDVGVNIDMKPTIHYDRDVTLKLKIEVSSQSGSTVISGVTEPIISQRQMEQVIRLKEGEANIVGGLLERSEAVTVSGTPGLGEIPIMKYLFSTQEREVVDDEIVFLLVPHVVRGTQLTPSNLQEIDSGTGTNVQLRNSDSADALVPGAPAPAPASSTKPAASSLGGSSGASPEGGPESSSGGSSSLLLSALDQADKVGQDLRIAVSVVGGKDLFSLPVQVHYDAAKLTLAGVDSGDFLGHDGQTVALEHQDDGNGNITVVASRPPGVAGVTGTGQVCILKFKPKASGDTVITSTSSMARNSHQETMFLAGTQASIHVQ